MRFKVVDGDIPPGMTLFTQGVSSAGITGRPTTEGVYQFTLQVRDQTGTPPGLSLSESPGRITGTPTTAGTFTFTVRVTDDRDAFAERTFSITIT